MSSLNLHFSPEFVRMVGWALLHFIWQGTVVAALLSLLLAICQRASARYALAVSGLLVMLALPFVTFFAMQQPAPQAASLVTNADTAPAVKSATPGPFTPRAYVAQHHENSQPEAMTWLVRLWMAGVVLFSLRSAGGFLLMQRLRRVANVPASGELLRLCLAMQQRMGVERAVRFCRSAALRVPAVVGGLRPIVLLPISALTGLTDSQIEAIVAHELAHVQRLDYFVNLFQVFAETVLFYHPAVWWVNKRIRIERENCCDDTAIAVCGNRLDYVRALTHLESARITPRFAMAADGSPLKARVRRLLGMEEESEGIRSGSSLLGVLVIVGLVLAASSLVSGAKAQNETPAPAPKVAVPPQPEAPLSPEIMTQPALAPTLSTPAVPALPSTEAIAPTAPESTVAPVVRIAPIHVHVPAVNIDQPAFQLHVPRVAVADPAAHLYVRPMNFAIPAMHVHVAMKDFTVPSIRPMLAQGATAPSTEAQPRPSESYIDSMKAAGAGDLTVDELVAMKIQGVTPEYVREMRSLGMKVDTDELIAMKVQGVTPEYVKQLRAAYPNIDTDTIVGFKVQGVSPEFAAEFAKLGIKADPDEIMGLKVQGVTAEYVRDMRATGINFDSDELIALKVQGVTPAYVSALKAAGIGKLDTDEIVGAKVMGITPEFIEKARSHGLKDLDLDKLIELKNAGVL